MNVLTRYIAREIFLSVILVLLAFLGLFIFFDFINEVESVGRDGYELYHALVYVGMIVPGRIYELLPVVVLIGSLYALTTLARNSEITVMRASGMSTSQMLRVLGLVGLVFVILTFAIGEYVAPPAERAAQQWRLNATGSAVSQQLRSGLWVKDGSRFINALTVMPDHTLHQVRIFEFDEERTLLSISEANKGRYDMSRSNWQLEDVWQTRFSEGRVELARLDELVWHTELSPDELSALMMSPSHMSVGALYAFIQHLEENRQNANTYQIALWKKISYPFTVLVMLALALPFAFTHDRMGGVSAKVFLGVMLGVGFHLLNGLFSNLGVINGWPPILAALTPALIFLLAAAAMLYWVERR